MKVHQDNPEEEISEKESKNESSSWGINWWQYDSVEEIQEWICQTNLKEWWLIKLTLKKKLMREKIKLLMKNCE